MSEFWVSKKKYFCQYCDIFIADDAPSRSHHENGMRHKGNKERFVRGLYKQGAQMKKDAEDEAREMKNIDAAAAKAYALDVGAGRGGVGGSAAPTPKPAAAPPKKPSNPFANYTTAASLGYTDPDAERIKAETERRQAQGVVGEWEYLPVDPEPVALLQDPSVAQAAGEDIKPVEEAAVVTGTKRPAEAPAVDEEDRGWKLRQKVARLGDLYDPGEIPIVLKAKKEEPAQDDGIMPVASGSGTTHADGSSAATNVPKWTKMQWKKATDTVESSPTSAPSLTTDYSHPQLKVEDVKTEDGADPLLQEPSSIKAEAVEAQLNATAAFETPLNTGQGLFKKRKARGGLAGTGKRDKF